MDFGTENLKVEDDNEVEEEEQQVEDEDGDKGFRSLIHGNDDDDAKDIFLDFLCTVLSFSCFSVESFWCLCFMVEEEKERGGWVFTLSESVGV